MTTNKLNLVLDLDETLIYSYNNIIEMNKKSFELNKHNYLFYEIINNSKDSETILIRRYYLFLRPYLITFLKKISNYYNLILYTNSTEKYATIIINYINYLIKLDSNIFTSIYYRFPNMTLIKTLERLKNLNPNIDSTNTIIIDDNKEMWDIKYHNILYQIPHFTIYNYDYNNDNMLNLLYFDLILYYYNYIFNQNISYNILTFN
jgi:TFIIF-interacting CTD phosphatase-like protein